MKTNQPSQKLSEQIRGQSMIVEPKGTRLNLRMVGLSILLDMSGELGETIQGGVIVPEGSRKKLDQIREATVVSVGPDVTGIKAGDKVLVRRVAIEQTSYLGVSYWITNPATIVAVIEEGTPSAPETFDKLP